MHKADMFVYSILDVSFTNGDISRSLFENFSPCLESTPNVQKSKINPEKGNLIVLNL